MLAEKHIRITTIVNRHDEFKMGYADDQIGVFDRVEPPHTIFHTDTETYATLWTEYDADFETSCDNCTSDMDTFKNVHTLDEYLFAKANAPANTFTITAVRGTSEAAICEPSSSVRVIVRSSRSTLTSRIALAAAWLDACRGWQCTHPTRPQPSGPTALRPGHIETQETRSA